MEEHEGHRQHARFCRSLRCRNFYRNLIRRSKFTFCEYELFKEFLIFFLKKHLFYVRRKLSPAEQQQLVKQSDYQKLNLGFFAKLTLSDEEKSLAEGIQAYIAGDIVKAETALKKAMCYVDAAFTLGFIYLNNKRFSDAISMFQQAEGNSGQIGAFYKKYQLEMTLTLPISPFLSVELPPDALTAYLAHAEALQQLQKTTEACNILLALYKKNPQNHLVII